MNDLPRRSSHTYRQISTLSNGNLLHECRRCGATAITGPNLAGPQVRRYGRCGAARAMNLTGELVALFDPDAPDVLETDGIWLIDALWDAEQPVAYVDLEPLTPASDVLTFDHLHHASVGPARPRVRNLPPATAGVMLIVTPEVAFLHPERTDLLIPCRPIREESGGLLGFRDLIRPVGR